jgi:hypothetical protein
MNFSVVNSYVGVNNHVGTVGQVSTGKRNVLNLGIGVSLETAVNFLPSTGAA